MAKSITFRLTLFFSTSSTLVLIVVGVLIGSLVERHFEEQDLAELNGKLQLIEYHLAQAKVTDDIPQVTQQLANALVGHPALIVALIGPDQNTALLTPGQMVEYLHPSSPISGTARRQDLIKWERHGHTFRGFAANVNTNIPGGDPYIVALGIDIEHHQMFMNEFRINLWLAVASAVVLTILLGWVAARRGLIPVRKMADVAKGISASHLNDRLPQEAVPTELTDLASAFNDMLARLEDSFRRLSEFSSDLAHEIRTPISNLMTQTQVAISKDRSANEYREILYSNLEEYERLARMISDMLFLAKADNGLIVPSVEQVNLAAEVKDLFGFYEAFAEEMGVKFQLEGSALIPGDRLMLRRALSNLLSNAIRYTPINGTVKVKIEKAGDLSIRIAVQNSGMTVPKESLTRLFDRFYRADPSRQKQSDGAGLGLAITKSIVESHKGRISAFSENGITVFEIILPSTTASGEA
jgi:two-component system heavy metal sensor histidine kinase CusS